MKTTNHRGINEVKKGNLYRVRVRWTDPRTGQRREADRLVVGTLIHARHEQARWQKEAENEAREQKPERKKLGDCARCWLGGKLPTLCPSTAERYTLSLEDHILPALGEFYVDAIGEHDIVAWRDALKRQGYAAATVNGHLRLLKTIMAKAVRSERLGFNPAAEVEALPEDDSRINQDEPNALTPEEMGRFLHAAKERQGQHYALILTLLVTGARMSAVLALRVEDLDAENGIIRFRRRRFKQEVTPGVKGRGVRARKLEHRVPLVPELQAVLQAHRARFTAVEAGSGWLFPTKAGKLHASTVLRKPFQDICQHGQIKKRFTPHGLRRTCNDLVRQVASEVVTRSITGHLTSAMHAHYSTVRADEQAAAVARAFRPVLIVGGQDGLPAQRGDQRGEEERSA